MVDGPGQEELRGRLGSDEFPADARQLLLEMLDAPAPHGEHQPLVDLVNRCRTRRCGGLVVPQVTLLVLAAAAARAGIVAADPRPRRCPGTLLEAREGLVGCGEAHGEIVLAAVRLRDGRGRLPPQDVAVANEERRHGPRTTRREPEVAFVERAPQPIALVVGDGGVGVRSGDRPSVTCDFPPHRHRQIGAALEGEPEEARPEVGAGRRAVRLDEGLVALERREEHEAPVLAERSDDRDARAGDPELWHVDAQDVVVVRVPPRRDGPEELACLEERRDHGGCDGAVLEVAPGLAVPRERRRHVREDGIQLGRRRDGDRELVAEGGAQLRRERRIGHPHALGSSRLTDQGVQHRGPQRLGKRRTGRAWIGDVHRDDERAGLLDPDADLGTERPALHHPEGGDGATAEPLASGRLRRRQAQREGRVVAARHGGR